MWKTQSPSSPPLPQNDLITSDDFLTVDDFHSDEIHQQQVRIIHPSQLSGNSNSNGNNNANRSNNSTGAKHVFLHSNDYSLFRKTERLVWQLNHLHANVNHLIQRSESLTNSTSSSSSSPTPSSPTSSARNIQVISSSVKYQKDLSFRKNRFLKGNNNTQVNTLDFTHQHPHQYSFDESVAGYASVMSVYTPEYNNNGERRIASMQNSPTVSDDMLGHYHGMAPFSGDLIMPRSMSIDQLNQATNSSIVRSVSIDEIHYNGSNNTQGVVILPPSFYSDHSPKPTNTSFHTHHESVTSIDVSSTASNEDIYTVEEQNSIELLPNTMVHSIYSKYGVVLTIDISPSMLAMDTTTGEVLFDRIFLAISNMITVLVQPLSIPNYNGDILPELHVTCIAIGVVGKPIISVFQDCHITKNNLNDMLGKIYQHICDLETMASNALKGFVKTNSENSPYNLKFSNYVKDSILAFDFLPKDACPILLLVTDSVFNLSDLNSDLILTINQQDIGFGVINTTTQNNGFGYLYSYVPDSELVESLVACVDGVYMDYDYITASDNEPKKTKMIHNALLLKSSSLVVSETNESLVVAASDGNIFSGIPLESVKKDVRKNFYEFDVLNYNLSMTNIDPILKTRSKQGFKITDLKYSTITDKLSKFKADEEKLDIKYVKMSMLLRRNIEIIYKIHIERTDAESEQEIDMLSTSNFAGFGITSKNNKAKISVSISVFMHKNNQEKFKAFLKKRTKEQLLKNIQDFVQSVNIEDVLIEQYFNLSESCSGINRSSIRKIDLSNVNFEHEKVSLFEEQTAILSISNDESLPPLC